MTLQDKNLENSDYVPALVAPNSPPDKQIWRENSYVQRRGGEVQNGSQTQNSLHLPRGHRPSEPGAVILVHLTLL